MMDDAMTQSLDIKDEINILKSNPQCIRLFNIKSVFGNSDDRSKRRILSWSITNKEIL